ncbi:MAG: arginine-tRNA-protein transferase [Parcubacteria group bacterium]|nr:arginine-tRNA-protein transferase [Parcubacteria group bacterium]
MRIFKSEFGHAYGTSYAFGYTEYAELENNEEPGAVYEHGYLPFSTNPDTQGLFYMARSVRVPLVGWEPNSENRRIFRKFDGQFECEIVEREALKTGTDFRSCFLTYFEKRHGAGIMSEARLNGILATPLPLRGVRYHKDGNTIGYVLEVTTSSMVHYWYSCFELERMESALGMWLMLDSTKRAKEDGRSHIYLGTAYGDKGKYKTNFSPLEFWDGSAWNADEKLLKRYISEDAEHRVPFTDRFNQP